MTQFTLDYAIWVFVSALAVLQASAAWSGLAGLLFLRPWPRATLRGSLLLAAAVFAWYFTSGRRNQPDTGLGLDGNEQAAWFTVTVGAAFALTLLLSSIVNHRWGPTQGWDRAVHRWPPSGVEWLRHTTFARAAAARARAAAGWLLALGGRGR
ncbi:MAG: hypothetical protein WD645_00740 [Dehalococcoidia bacterium]